MPKLTAKTNTANAQQYLNSLNNYLSKDLKNMIVREQMEVIMVYKRAYMDIIEKGLEKAAGDQKKIDKLTAAYAQQIYEELSNVCAEYNKRIPPDIMQLQCDTMAAFLADEDNKKFMEQVKKIANITSRKTVQQMIQGNIYYDGKGLSDRIGDASKTSSHKLKEAISSCIAQGMGAADMSQNLKEFAMGGHHTWSRNKIREKLGDGYARKYGSGGLDYEALRLARAT